MILSIIAASSFMFCDGGDVMRHSFGVGGFDTNEVFDTEIQCEKCSAPSTGDEATAACDKYTHVYIYIYIYISTPHGSGPSCTLLR